MDAITFLTTQHRQLEDLFGRYEANTSRQDLLDQVELLLSVHSALEEQYVYPMLAGVAGYDALLARGQEDARFLQELMQGMQSLAPRTPHYDCCMRRLIASAREHMREEEESDVGLVALMRAAITSQGLRRLGRDLRAAAIVAAAQPRTGSPNATVVALVPDPLAAGRDLARSFR